MRSVHNHIFRNVAMNNVLRLIWDCLLKQRKKQQRHGTEGQVNRMHRCPHCGSIKGLYSKYTLYGLQRYYGFNGSCEDNMDNAHQKGGQILYCQNCNKAICKLEEWEDKQNE